MYRYILKRIKINKFFHNFKTIKSLMEKSSSHDISRVYTAPILDINLKSNLIQNILFYLPLPFD